MSKLGDVVCAVVIAFLGLGVLFILAESLAAMPGWLVVGFTAWLVYLFRKNRAENRKDREDRK